MKKIYFFTGLFINVFVLVIFKYANFFIESFNSMLELSGIKINTDTLNIILPLGISFYTFLAISYIVDVYKGHFKAERNFVNVLLSTSFFPILLAGPIERPSSLIPQLKKERVFDDSLAEEGFFQILWGLFMKIVIADNCASFADKAFSGYTEMKGIEVFLGIFFFVIQIYSDFAGYSHIAIGLSKTMGFRIIRNFSYPYFAKDIKEFWKRWNISLTNWFRDYTFLPVAFALSRKIKAEQILGIRTETIIYIVGSVSTWMLTGLWHGASYSFIIWGLTQGVFLIIYHIMMKPRKKLLKKIGMKNSNLIVAVPEYLFTLSIIFVSFTFFKAGKISDVAGMFEKIFSGSLFSVPELKIDKIILFGLTGTFMIIEWLGRKHENPASFIQNKIPRKTVWIFYYALIMTIFLFGGKQQQFIYLQF
ncbi:MAG: MBOAT family protein [Candidatus Delongbacteria bacterium]|nr:MBOAT family protein [Candidatus Delongbacteria bacterium]